MQSPTGVSSASKNYHPPPSPPPSLPPPNHFASSCAVRTGEESSSSSPLMHPFSSSGLSSSQAWLCLMPAPLPDPDPGPQRDPRSLSQPLFRHLRTIIALRISSRNSCKYQPITTMHHHQGVMHIIVIKHQVEQKSIPRHHEIVQACQSPKIR